jgi:chromosome segregation ATPase
MVSRSKKQTDSPAEYLETELRDAKARLHKVEGELEQALKQVWSLDAIVRKMSESLSVSGSVSSAVQGFREEVRQLRDQIGRLQDRQSAMGNRVDQVLSQRQSDSGREKQDTGTLVKRMDAITKSLEHYDNRMKALEEIARHVEEEVASTRLAHLSVERIAEESNTRSARAQEASLRLDQEVSRFSSETDKLQKEDEAHLDRYRLIVEQVRRLNEQTDKLELLEAFQEQVREHLQSAAFERQQLSERSAAAEHLATEATEGMKGFVQGLARLDQYTQKHTSDLLTLTVQIQELGEQTAANLKRIYQILTRQARRRAEGLNAEIKELTQGELHSGD